TIAPPAPVAKANPCARPKAARNPASRRSPKEASETIRERRSPRPVRCRPDRNLRQRQTEAPPPKRSTTRDAGPSSSQLTFDERYLPDLFVLDRTVAEVPVLAEQLSVVGGDGDVGVLRD